MRVLRKCRFGLLFKRDGRNAPIKEVIVKFLRRYF